MPNHRGYFTEQLIPTSKHREGVPLDIYGVNVSKHLEVTQRHTAVLAGFVALMRAKGYTCYPEAYIRDVSLYGADLPQDKGNREDPLYAPLANNEPRRCDWAFIDRQGRQCFVDITFTNPLGLNPDGS